jgi:hypothetical protein
MKLRILAVDHKDDAVVQQLAVPDIVEAEVTVSQANYLLTNGIKFDGVEAYVEVPVATLDEDVPSNFKNSVVYEGDPDNPTTRQKTWAEYTQYISNGTNAILKVGYHNANGNRARPVTSVELQDWIDEYGAGNILLPEEAKALRESDYGEN